MSRRQLLLLESFAYFLGGALATWLAVVVGIPLLARKWGIPPAVGWFLTSGILVAVFFFVAIAAARRTTASGSFAETTEALRLRPLNRADLAWALGGLVGVVLLTGGVVTAFSGLFAINLLSKESYATFLQMEALQPGQFWLLLAWLPYFFFNIAGEELLWRGYLLPRQAEAVGSRAWVLNGVLWAVFHAAIGWRIAVILIPIEFIVPYVVQKRQNTWLGVIIHGLYNGSGFILVAFGIVK